MGYLRPTAIIVGASYRSDDLQGPHWIDVAHARAHDVFGQVEMGQLVSEVVEATNNGERSFLVAWDGSKEGWDDSDKADEARTEYVEWLREQAYGDGSSPLDWVELQYGGDDREAIVLAHSGEPAPTTSDRIQAVASQDSAPSGGSDGTGKESDDGVAVPDTEKGAELVAQSPETGDVRGGEQRCSDNAGPLPGDNTVLGV